MKWNPKAGPWILLLIMAALTIFLVARKGNSKTPAEPKTKKERTVKDEPRTDPTSPGNDRNSSFNRHPAQINYSKHALCRMDCRHIDQTEIAGIVANGTINEHKSDMRASPDPRYALEGTTRDGQQVRIIVAQSARVSTIVTVIDLDTNWNCHCPGDEKKKH